MAYSAAEVREIATFQRRHVVDVAGPRPASLELWLQAPKEDSLICFENDRGDQTIVPWKRCRSWSEVKDILIRDLWHDDEQAKKRLKDDSFLLTQVTSQSISASTWQYLFQPLRHYKVELKYDDEVDDMRRRLDALWQFSDAEHLADHHLPQLPDDLSHELLAELMKKPASSNGLPGFPADNIPSFLVDEVPPRFISEPSTIEQEVHAVDPADSEETVKPLEETVQYTIKYNHRDEHYRDRLIYQWSTSTTGPPVLKRLWGTTGVMPVLEEFHDVVLPTSEPSSVAQQRILKEKGLRTGDEIVGKQLKINSQPLLNALYAVANYKSAATGVYKNTDAFANGVFAHPYRDLYHHKNLLLGYKRGRSDAWKKHDKEYNDTCSRHIDLLMKYLYAQTDIGLEDFERRTRGPHPRVTFMSYWLLLKPGEDVYVVRDGQLNAYVVEKVTGGVKFSQPDKYPEAKAYVVDLWNLWFDGSRVGRVSTTVTIPIFDGERTLTSLPIIPTRYHDVLDAGKLRSQLIDRGKVFYECCKGPKFMEFTSTGQGKASEYRRARVVVDHDERPWKYVGGLGHDSELPSAASRHDGTYGDPSTLPGANARTPACECPECTKVDRLSRYTPVVFSEYDNVDPKNVQQLSDHQLLLCPQHVYAYVLKDKRYEICRVEQLCNPIISEKAIDSLVMRTEGTKDAIKAIVKTYTDTNLQSGLFRADFIHGKGEGQIFLLHGPPGTGKTLTAESVAEYVRRPLLSISAADLGHGPEKVEENLLRFFKRAHRWDCVVLLDEADVYLERRDTNDLERNSVVTVFLRVMEYFQGILFLTTNRVGHIDEAFQSRIHLSIGYPALDDEAREQIWANLFRKLTDDFEAGLGREIRYEYDAKEYTRRDKDLKRLQWNGREIRNAFQTVVALAVFDANQESEKATVSRTTSTTSGRQDPASASTIVVPKIREKHLRQVVSMSQDFRNYMQSAHEGMDDRDRAFLHGNRDDAFHAGQRKGES